MFDIWHIKGQDIYLCYHQFSQVYLCSLSLNLAQKKNLAFHESVLLLTVFAKHRVPLHIMCDCGLEFMSQFFRSLGALLNIKIHFTLGYNPQADGQSERANQMLEEYL